MWLTPQELLIIPTAEKMTPDCMMQYWASMRAAIAQDKHVGLCVDGVRAGCDELLV